jgi:hypothetical protein
MFDRTLENFSRSSRSSTAQRSNGARHSFPRSASLLLALLLAACGGGGGSTPNAAGTGNAMVRGTLQSVSGGLTVNGVTFATNGATLSSSDEAGPVTLAADDAGSHLRPGMVVSVRGRMDDATHGEATEVEFHDELEGEIEAHGAGEIEVEGVHVSLDDDSTGLDKHGGSVKPEDLSVGTRVAISGHADSHGGLRATLVRERDAAGEREVRGFIVTVNGNVLDLAFVPSGPVAVQVDLSGIVPPPSFPVGTLVEVKTQGAAGVGGVFTATAIHAEDALSGEAEDQAEVEGVVTAADASGFTVGGQRVVTSASTIFEGGTAADVAVGVELEAEGTLQADGSLLARDVKLRAAVRIEAKADAVDAAGGTLTVIGIAVHVTPSTELHGFGSLADLTSGTPIEVRGIPTSDGGVDALRVDLPSGGGSTDRAFLRGVVSATTPPAGLTILGIVIDLSGAELSGGFLSTQAFLDAITPGKTLVKVRWRPYPATTSQPVDEAEIEQP